VFTARYVLHFTFCPHSVFMCCVWIWEQTAIISLYSTDWLVFVTDTECVYCAVRTGSLQIIQFKFNVTPLTILLQSSIHTLFKHLHWSLVFSVPVKCRLTVRYRHFGSVCSLYLRKGGHFCSDYLPKRLQLLGRPAIVINLYLHSVFMLSTWARGREDHEMYVVTWLHPLALCRSNRRNVDKNDLQESCSI